MPIFFLLLRAARQRYCGAEVEGRVHRPGAIPFGRVHAEDERADLSAAFSRSVEVGAGTGKQDGGGSCVRLAKSDTYESADKTVGESGGDRQAVYFSYGKAYVYDDDADTRRGSLHDLEATRSCRCENDAGVRQDHQSEKGRCGKFGERVVRLIFYC